MKRQTAAAVAESALQSVLDPAVVSRMREDSPLSVAGFSPSDAVALAEAVALAAVSLGESCILNDADLEGVTTVDDLIALIEREASEPVEEP